MNQDRSETARRDRAGTVDGLLLLDKPTGMTSNAALCSGLNGCSMPGRPATRAAWIHWPAACCPSVLGQATKLSAFLLDAAEDLRGHGAPSAARTDTGDADGDGGRAL